MAYLRGIDCCVPETVLSNDDLARLNPGWRSEAIYAKTGIRSRRVAAAGETAADLGYRAAESLLARLDFDRGSIDALLFCTESPDYPLPPSACIMHERLKLPQSCAAFDFNLGCSGFVYGLWLANALIASGAAHNVLLVVGDTYSKYCSPHDLVTATIFGDGAAAVLITASDRNAVASLGPAVLGTDGRGAEHLIVRAGAARLHGTACASACGVQPAPPRQPPALFMNGPEVFSFTLSAVPAGIQRLLDRLGAGWEDIDLYLLHQANRFMLEQLRLKMKLPPEKMPIDIEDLGNTVSATIPILMRRCELQGVLKPNHRCILAGFGVGYSWGMMYLEWRQ